MGLAPSPARGEAAADALGELRSILFGAEAVRLADVEAELRALGESRLSRADLKTATARVLAEALREAEVADHRALADALAPLIVRAIQAEIRNSRDAMVEALYPIVGRLVAAAVADGLRRVTETVAERIDALISTRRWTWRMKALATGRSVAEIALAETQRARVVRVLCLERGSGQLIAVWPQAELDGRSDMMSGLIAAITEFAATTFAAEGGALRALDLGARRVLLRTSATLIVAAECDGVLRPQDEIAIDEAFLELIGRHDRIGQIAPDDLARLDGALIAAAPERKPGKAATWALRLAGFGLAGWMLWSAGLALVHWTLERRVDRAFAAARAAAPGAEPWPLRLEVDHDARRVTMIGLAPTREEEARMMAALRAPAEPYTLAERVEIIPPAETTSAGLDSIARQTQTLAADARRADEAAARALAAQRAETRAAFDAERAQTRETIDAERARMRQTVDAADKARAALGADLASARADAAAARATLDALQGRLATLEAAAAAPRPRLRDALRESSMYFTIGSSDFADPRTAEAAATLIAGLMNESGARVRIIGHTDESGSSLRNQHLSRARAEAAARLLTKQGAKPDQLLISSKRAGAPASDDGAAAANRRVTFEIVPDNEPSP